MKQLLPLILFSLFAFAGCKKEYTLSNRVQNPSIVTVSGDVILTSQAEVDSFVKKYTCKKLQINGDLAIGLPRAIKALEIRDWCNNNLIELYQPHQLAMLIYI